MPVPVVNSTLQLRKLNLRLQRQLETILDSDDLWKQLMCAIPKSLDVDPSMSKISEKNPPKYNTEHFKIIECVSVNDRRSCTNILLDEWGTSGKVLPTLGHLFYLLKEAGIYRAGDLVADLMGVPRPERPQLGPDAAVKIEDVNPTDLPVVGHLQRLHFGNEDPSLDSLLSDSTDVSKSIPVKNLPNLPIFQFTTEASAQYLPQLPEVDIKYTSNAPITPLLEGSVPNLQIFQSTTLMSSEENNSQLKCPSPLPSLSLNTSLPHISYVNLERCTNNFNTHPFTSKEDSGRYLGHGTFGSVFVAFDLMKQPVAIKKLNLDIMNMNKMEEVTKQFCNEVETLSKFKHDHLLELLGYSHDGSTYCLAYEYMSGGTLHDKLKAQKGRLHWKERLDISLGLSQAITYLHTQFKDPVVHRDIKSPNILLDGSNKAKLGDFGLVRNLYNRTSTFTSAIGTSAYMSDEALRGEISYKMDTYSFGIVLLELLTSLPVTDESRQEVCLNEHAEYLYSIDGNGCNLLDRHDEVGDWLTKEMDIGEKLIEIALKCLKKKKIRPHQKEVTENLLDLAKYM